MYLTDITFIDEGNKDVISDLVNFQKRRLMYKVLREIEQYQAQPYDLTVVPNVLAFLSELPHNDSDELFRLSLIREPRNVENKSALT